jgi:hypothetical protein
MAQNKLQIVIAAKDTTGKVFRGLNRALAGVGRSILNMKSALVGLAGAAGLGLLIKSSLDSIDTLGKTASKLGVTTAELQKLRYASELAGVQTRTVDMAVQRFTRRLSEAAIGTGEAKDALIELGLNARELSQQPLEDQMLALASAFEKVESNGDKVRLAFKLFDSEGVAFINTLQGGTAALQEMFDEVDDLGIVLSSKAVKGVEDANDSFTRLLSLFKGVRDSVVSALAPAFRTLADSIRTTVIDAIPKGAGGIEKFGRDLALTIIGIFKRGAEAIQAFTNETIRQLNRVIEFSKSAGEALGIDWAKKLQPLNVKDLGLVGVFETLEEEINATGAAFERTNKSGKDFAKTGENIKETFDKTLMSLKDVKLNGVNALEDALVSVIDRTSSVKDAFKSMARSIISDLIRMQIQQSITGPLASFMGFNVGGSSPSGKAIGGPVQAGQPYVVGERGPEMFVPNQSGSIVPNGRMGGGGIVVNQTVNISTGVQQTVRAEVMQMLPQISNAAKGAVLDARRRGGSFAAAF